MAIQTRKQSVTVEIDVPEGFEVGSVELISQGNAESAAALESTCFAVQAHLKPVPRVPKVGEVWALRGKSWSSDATYVLGSGTGDSKHAFYAFNLLHSSTLNGVHETLEAAMKSPFADKWEFVAESLEAYFAARAGAKA